MPNLKKCLQWIYKNYDAIEELPSIVDRLKYDDISFYLRAYYSFLHFSVYVCVCAHKSARDTYGGQRQPAGANYPSIMWV